MSETKENSKVEQILLELVEKKKEEKNGDKFLAENLSFDVAKKAVEYLSVKSIFENLRKAGYPGTIEELRTWLDVNGIRKKKEVSPAMLEARRAKKAAKVAQAQATLPTPPAPEKRPAPAAPRPASPASRPQPAQPARPAPAAQTPQRTAAPAAATSAPQAPQRPAQPAPANTMQMVVEDDDDKF